MGHLRALVAQGLARKVGGIGGDAAYYRTAAGRKALGYPPALATCTACDRPHKHPNRKKGARLCKAMLCIGCVTGKECEGRMPPWAHQRDYRGADGKVPCPGRQALDGFDGLRPSQAYALLEMNMSGGSLRAEADDDAFFAELLAKGLVRPYETKGMSELELAMFAEWIPRTFLISDAGRAALAASTVLQGRTGYNRGDYVALAWWGA